LKTTIKRGLSFGLTSGVTTTLGLAVGLSSGTHSRLAVIGGVITIAIADSMSDAFGVHISEEATTAASDRDVWEATIATFVAKLACALTFLVPVLVLPLDTGIVASVVWGLFLLAVLSYLVARANQASPARVIAEHLSLAVAVVVLVHVLGTWIHSVFV
jgi:VIT1/CCC1 family predicted Fe2+/Mn2+ transporter